MTSIRSTAFFAAAALVAGLGFAAPASAQATRTWVSGVGDDANPCSRTAPCKTFAGAISKTATGGEINCLDPGGFGAVTIVKSITIDCVGTNGSLLAANSNGFIINGAGAVVTLRNVAVNGASTTTGNAIRILQAAAVNIDHVIVENFGGTGTNGKGVSIETATANVKVNIQNSSFYNITNFDVHSNPSAGNVLLYIDHSTFARGGTTAIQLRANTLAFINDASITGHNPGAAVAAELTSVTTHISNSFFANNQFGVFSGNGGSPTTRIYGTVITGSATDGLNITSGSIFSYGNNAIRGNAGNETPTGAVLGTQ
ncbi:MAG: hypothetical protein JOZ90_07020 [Alphaproteobacteria bacterium]|nr:hypothetical protein [Alphaproteobacteria bacterium]MBV9370426.1 hypothetical protein [Alphaproteobacteria bacterium]MBV9900834.1 hypothetical protein [Alphaproteobacteria bacterium]